jgi:hypothetical protein
MTIDVKLGSGLVLKDAASMLIAKFSEWPWENYDGSVPSDPNRIDPVRDINRVYQLGVRTPRDAYMRMINADGDNLSSLLRLIPQGIALEDANLNVIKEPIINLYDIASSYRSIKLAGATKLFYPFRPALLPVIDSVVENYYWYASSIKDERSFRRLAAIEGWGAYIFEMLCMMQSDLAEARESIDEVISACHGYSFAAISRVRALESLIWYYYAR